MKLICEQLDNVEFICEDTKKGKNYFIEGVFMQANVKNRNGRLYPKAILQKEAKRYDQNYIKQSRAFGELGHPEGPTVNLERVSHMITDLYPDGKNFIGEAKIMATPMGEIVKNLMDEGAKLGVSSRGMGSLQSRGGTNYVKDDFYLATAADIVADPSAPNAFVEGIMEGKEWVWNNGALVEEELLQMQREFDVKQSKMDEKRKALAFAKFLKRL